MLRTIAHRTDTPRFLAQAKRSSDCNRSRFISYTNKILRIEDTKVLFKNRTTPDLIRRFALLKFISWGWVAKYGPRMFQVFDALYLKKVVYALFVKPLVFNHFCAGEITEEAMEIVKTNPLKTVLFLSFEPGKAHTAEWYDKVAQEYANCAKSSTILKGAFGALKVGGLTHGHFLKKLSSIVCGLPLNLATSLDSTKSLVDFVSAQSGSKLSSEELIELELLVNRLDLIFAAARDANVPQLIDGEQTFLQSMIDFLALFFMKKYNKEKPVVWSTYQMYKKDTKGRLLADIELAEKEDFHIAFKIVRGAYLPEERRLSVEQNYPDPIHDTLQDTHNDFNETTKHVLSLIKAKKKVSVMVASHNVQSNDLAASYMCEIGIPKDSPQVCFAQLQGMCDHISYSLLAAGFKVYKLYPYGPIDEMMPYLIRRLNENAGFMGITSVERSLLLKETTRRLCGRE